jgi:putative hemolysin
MIGYPLSIALFILCILLSAFFSASEAVLVSITRARVRALAGEARKGSSALAALKEAPDRVLVTTMAGSTLVHIAAAAIVTSVAVSHYGDIGIAVAIVVVTLLILTFGQIGPRIYAVRASENFALSVAPVVLYLSRLMAPVLWITGRVSNVPVSTGLGEPVVTEEEIKEWIDVGKEGGSIEAEEKEMLYSVLEFGDTTAREIMTPRIDVSMMEDTLSVDDAIRIFNETGFSRIPVYHESVDNIVGVLNVKDVFSTFLSGRKEGSIREIMYDPFFVPETKKIDDLLKELQVRKVQMAIVLDEYSSFAGIVTVEDILEELVGDILDEFDQEEPDIQKVGEGVYIVDAQKWVEELNEELGIHLPLHESYETIGGLFIDRHGHIPHPGESISVREAHATLVVVQMRGRRIVKVKIIIRAENHDGTDEKQA